MDIKDTFRTLFYQNNHKPSHQLMTYWGENLDPNHLLDDYPRPSRVRESYINLNGYWDCYISQSESMPNLNLFKRKILVPFSPESVLSGINHALKPNETLWYRKVLSFDQIPQEKRLLVHFGAVDQTCTVYINGTEIMTHTGGYLPFSVDLTDSIILGDNQLILKVKDQSDKGYHAKGKQRLKRGGMFYTAQSGIWQTVWAEWVPTIYVTHHRITSQIDTGCVTFHFECNQPSQSLPCHLRIEHEGINLMTLDFKSTDLDISVTLPPDRVKYWTPNSPVLYQVHCQIGLDTFETYFAYREVSLNPCPETGKMLVHLNHQPLFINGLLDQGYWPDGLMTAPSDEALIFDIEKAKTLGFNLLRKHIKIEPERFYYHCDRLGMLVCQDMVNGGKNQSPIFNAYLPTGIPAIQPKIKDSNYALFSRHSKKGRQEWLNECDMTVNLLINHPSIIMWCPFNEGWGQFDALKVYDRIKALDPTRVIDHASGWYDQGIGDFLSIHNYFRPLKMMADKRAYFISEFGGYACRIEGHSFSDKTFGYKIYLSTDSFNDAFQKLYHHEVLPLKKQGLCGVVYTQLSDVEEEVNGLITYDRKICKVQPLVLE